MIFALHSGAETLPKTGDGLVRKNSAVVNARGVHFAWNQADSPVLTIEKFVVETGERLFVEGPSGCGKSTFLSLLAGVTTPSSGTIRVMEKNLEAMTGACRDRFRADHVGVIFQMFNLLPYLSVMDNVTLPCQFSPRRKERAQSNGKGMKEQAAQIITRLGLGESLLRTEAAKLSVGQQQRVAVARALMGRPEIIIADEPTSSLDTANTRSFLDLLFDECSQNGTSLIFASHDTALASHFDRVVNLEDINTAAGTTAMKQGVLP